MVSVWGILSTLVIYYYLLVFHTRLVGYLSNPTRACGIIVNYA